MGVIDFFYLFKMKLPDLIYKNSNKILEYNNPTVNYHPQSDDKYYPSVLPSKLEIREFILEDKKEELKRIIENLIKGTGKINQYEVTQKGKPTKEINFENSKTTKIIEEMLKLFPAKAFIIKTDHTLNVLTQYDKVKEEISEIVKNNSDLSTVKPRTILYYALSTAYNLENIVSKWQNSINDTSFYGDIQIDSFGKKGFKGFMENAAYIPTPYNILSLGTFISFKDSKVYNASQDSDVVNHEIGHSILDRIRSNYIDSKFSLDGAAIHEAFSDINAFLIAAMDENINVLPQDLDKPNAISSIGELLGKSIYTQVKIEQEILNKDPFGDFSKVEDNRPIRELSKIVEYKPYEVLAEKEKEEHSYSLALSTTFYRAFSEYAKSVGDVKKAAKEFFKVFSYGTVISPVAPTTLPDFYKSFIIADILYNDSKLSPFLIKAGKESKLIDTDIEKIKKEIEESKNIDLSKFKQIINSNETKVLEEFILNILKEKYQEFSLIKELKISLVPGLNEGINIEGIYTYPVNLSYEGKDYPIYGGILLVFDRDFNLIYSNIEKPNIQKVANMQDYVKILEKNSG